MQLEINNLTKFTADKKSFSQVAKIVLRGENKGTATLSLAFVDEKKCKS
jgi:ssRNA-specific RNase YbeY (16S rRNA maturation enzyme)